ncbi:MAG: hypothetical protein ACRDY1_06605 [Acidimicrobiales bacterium]
MVEDRADGGDLSIGGQAFTTYGRPSKTFPEGRTCGEPDCGTKLSIYNESEYCYQHDAGSAPRLRGRKSA